MNYTIQKPIGPFRRRIILDDNGKIIGWIQPLPKNTGGGYHFKNFVGYHWKVDFLGRPRKNNKKFETFVKRFNTLKEAKEGAKKVYNSKF